MYNESKCTGAGAGAECCSDEILKISGRKMEVALYQVGKRVVQRDGTSCHFRGRIYA
jgi:hypothetical protein